MNCSDLGYTKVFLAYLLGIDYTGTDFMGIGLQE